MSVLSITAPQFTAEDERLEQEMATHEEEEAALNDIWGTQNRKKKTRTIPSYDDDVNDEVSNNIKEAEQERMELGSMPEEDALLISLEQEISHIQLEEKEAYMEAIELAPQLVELESSPRLFLMANKFAPERAAMRLINYWELRRWLFGERAWLPLTATGNGALCLDDVRLLKTGFCVLLDETDTSSRGIIHFQVPLTKLESDCMAMVRVIFYVLTVAIERPNIQENGLVLVADTRNYTTSRFDRKFIKCAAYLFTGNYFHINTKAYHICAPPGKSCIILVLPFIKYFMTKNIRQRLLLHQGTTTELTKDLQDYGIPTSNLMRFMSTPTRPQRSGTTGSSTVSHHSAHDGTTKPNGQQNYHCPVKAICCWEDWMEERRQIEFIREEELFGPENEGNGFVDGV